MRRRRKRNDRKTAYAEVRLDEGEDWTLTPYPSDRLSSTHYPGDALGVYSGLALSTAGSGDASSTTHSRNQSQNHAYSELGPSSSSSAPPTIIADSPTTHTSSMRHDTINTTAGTFGSGTSTPSHSPNNVSPFADAYHERRYSSSDSPFVDARRIRREEDAGLLMTDQDDDVHMHMGSLPPDYSQAASARDAREQGQGASRPLVDRKR